MVPAAGASMLPRPSRWTLSVLLLLLLPVQVSSQNDFNLADALDDVDVQTSAAPATRRPGPKDAGTGKDFSLEDLFKADPTVRTTTTKAPKSRPKIPTTTVAVRKPRPKPAGGDFNLADALDKNQTPGGSFSDSDLEDVGRDNTYKPDKGKGGHQRGDGGQTNHDENSVIAPEVGTIAGIISAVGMALVGAISGYISYQKKKLCFSIQQSLNADISKAEVPEGVVATEPHAQQTLLEQPKSGAPSEDNHV